MHTSTLSAARYMTPARQLPGREDIIDTPLESSPDVHHSIETQDQDIDLGYLSTDTDGGYMMEERLPKRLRFSSSLVSENDDRETGKKKSLDGSRNPPLPTTISPVSRRPVPLVAPRFLPSAPSNPHQDQNTFIKPPRFRVPEPPEQGQLTDPPPEHFSPRKRGQKYVAGGLAAEVRDWLVDMSSPIPSNSNTRKDSPWLVRLMVDEISGGERAGFTLVRGRQVLSDDVDTMIDSFGVISVILAGEGASTGLQNGTKVEVGTAVGIKSPVWDVMIEGEKWGVGVDWEALAGLES